MNRRDFLTTATAASATLALSGCNDDISSSIQIKDIPVALYALGTCPRKYIPVTDGERGVHLSFGGIGFKNGDYLYADTDGVIVTPEKIV